MKVLSAVMVAFVLILLTACTGSDVASNAPAESLPPESSPVTAETELPSSSSGSVVVEFDFEKQSGHASNQFAIWIEDADGHLVKTLYATDYTATGGYKNRPDSIALWVEKSELSSMEKSQVDAITGATPKAGSLSYTWDLTNENGDTVLPGEYTVYVEGSLRWKNSVLYSCNIVPGDSPSTVQADVEYTYEATDSQPALTSDSPENDMLKNVIVKFIPAT